MKKLERIFQQKQPTMSSVEIADLTGKRHDHVMRDIEKQIGELLGEEHLPKFGGIYSDNYGRNQKCYDLPKRETLILVSGYSVELRAKIIDRWEYLEKQAQKDIQAYKHERQKSKKIRRDFTDTLKDHGCDKQHHYINITKSQKAILGITARKDDMNKKELILVQMAELLSTYNLTDERGYYEVKPVTDSSANNVMALTAPKEQIAQ